MMEVECGTYFTLTVTSEDDAPEIAEIENQEVSEDNSVEISISVSDVDDTLSVSSLSLESSDSSIVGEGNYSFESVSELTITQVRIVMGRSV